MKQARFSLSQETITILSVGAALAGLLLVMLGDSRAERARLDAAMREMRAEGQAYRKAFDNKITRLIEQQGTLNGLVDSLRNPSRQRGNESRGRRLSSTAGIALSPRAVPSPRSGCPG